MNVFAQPIDRILCKNKICSMRNAPSFIRCHEVFVNGMRIKDSRFLVDTETDSIFVDGVQIPMQKNIYIMMNKALNVVCSKASDSHKVLYDFFPSELAKDLHSCGRLDADSTGLIFLTNNGTFSHFFESPETHLEKTYSVRLKNPVLISEQEEYIKAFKSGISVPPYKKGEAFVSKPAQLTFKIADGDIDSDECTVVISEGKYRQIRRMFSALGNEVVALKRLSIGHVELDPNLGENQWRELSDGEVKGLGRVKKNVN